MKKKKKKVRVMLCICAILAVFAAGTWYILNTTLDEEKTFSEIPPSPANKSYESVDNLPSITLCPTVTPTYVPLIQVHICGNVVNPGVVTVEQGSRLITAIEAAGGFLWSADESYLNLARVVSDGERIYVPGYLETETLTVAEKAEGTDGPDGPGGRGLWFNININTASVSELTQLPGIGESRARDIVAYRTKVGAFAEKEDIKNVSGIGEAMFNRIKDMISVR